MAEPLPVSPDTCDALGYRVKATAAMWDVGGGGPGGRAIAIEDGDSIIKLRIDGLGAPLVLSPGEARFLGRALFAASDRIVPAPRKAKLGGGAGAAGGRARAVSLSPERRSEIASIAASTRWGRRGAS